MAPSLYPGPVALAQSKHASPQQKKIAPVTNCLADISPVKYSANNAIATKEQVADAVKGATLDMTLQNADAQLAVIQGNVLKQEVEKHAARFSNTISNTVKTTRKLLELLRRSIEKENVADLHIVEHLWAELEQLFTAAHETRAAIPAFLEKQRNNTSLFYTSAMHESMRERQQELNIQNKKLNIQDSLILEHQEAFHDYKTQNTTKLKELEDLQERVSRLTLEKGNFRTELDKYKQLVVEEKAAKHRALETGDSLRREHDVVLASRANLQVECDNLRKVVDGLQEKTKGDAQQVVDRFAAELQVKVDELAKEAQKVTDLNGKIRAMKEGERNIEMETEKAKSENNFISSKYKMLSVEHAKAFTKLTEQMKVLESLTVEIERIRIENTQLLKQVETLSAELHTNKEKNCFAQTEILSLIEKTKLLEHNLSILKAEKQNSVSGRADAEKAIQALAILKDENSKLKAAVDELNSGHIASAPCNLVSVSEEKGAQQEKIRALEAEIKKLEISVSQWTDLAKQSYSEYKEMLPMYRKANQYHKEAVEKENLIENLKLELSASKQPQLNDTAAASDIAYWKDKYESLLATIGG